MGCNGSSEKEIVTPTMVRKPIAKDTANGQLPEVQRDRQRSASVARANHRTQEVALPSTRKQRNPFDRSREDSAASQSDKEHEERARWRENKKSVLAQLEANEKAAAEAEADAARLDIECKKERCRTELLEKQLVASEKSVQESTEALEAMKRLFHDQWEELNANVKAERVRATSAEMSTQELSLRLEAKETTLRSLYEANTKLEETAATLVEVNEARKAQEELVAQLKAQQLADKAAIQAFMDHHTVDPFAHEELVKERDKLARECQRFEAQLEKMAAHMGEWMAGQSSQEGSLKEVQARIAKLATENETLQREVDYLKFQLSGELASRQRRTLVEGFRFGKLDDNLLV